MHDEYYDNYDFQEDSLNTLQHSVWEILFNSSWLVPGAPLEKKKKDTVKKILMFIFLYTFFKM